MSDLIINVNGTSVISRRAERAVVTVRVSSEGPSQRVVSDEVTQSSKELQNLFRGLAAEIPLSASSASPKAAATVTFWSMASLTTHSYTRANTDKYPNDTKPVRVYSASTTFEVKFSDFERLGAVATQLSLMKHVIVDRIVWRLTDATRASLATQSRTDAVKDAMAKARDYAAAAGRGTVSPVEISDSAQSGYKSGVLFGQASRSVARSGGGAGAFGGGGDEALSFQPEHVDLESSVQVKFIAKY